MDNKTLKDFLVEHGAYNYLYCNRPYSCGIEESLGHFKNYVYPPADRTTISKDDNSMTVSIKPIKGSGKRKSYIIMMYK